MLKKTLLLCAQLFVFFSFFTVYLFEAAHAAEQYFYATATDNGVKMRNGPGVQYTENDLRLNKNAYANAPNKILYDDYLFGLIVDNSIVKGDAVCSAWQKIVAVHTSWNSEEQVKPLCETENGTNNFKCSETAYICKDFIKTTPINYPTQTRDDLMKQLRKINGQR